MDVRTGRRRHIIRRMCEQGDTSVRWETGAGVEADEEAQAAIREAERIFHEALTHGDVPFAIERGQTPQKLIGGIPARRRPTKSSSRPG